MRPSNPNPVFPGMFHEPPVAPLPPRPAPSVPSGDGCCQRLAALFLRHPGAWLDGRQLATVAGAYAWRTRASELRKPPYNMRIDNRVRRIEENGKTYQVSEYRFVVDTPVT
jgi:hypothetical protein